MPVLARPQNHVYAVYMSTKEAILSAAWRCFDNGGEAAISLRRVAADVGLTPMAIYRHFANRQALLDALVLAAIGEWRRRVAAIAPAAPAEMLRSIARAYLDFALGEPRRFEAAFLVASPVVLRYPDDFLGEFSPALKMQLSLIAQAMPDPAPDDDAATILLTMIALAQGLVTLHRAGRIAGDEACFGDLYMRAIDRCLGTLSSGSLT
jgi:AcrR family transcriptional regulator